MFITCIAMVKNEADIIEAFCRHNSLFFDMIFIVDNGSVDGTKDIILALAREGLPIIFSEDPEFAYRQSERMTRTFNNVCHAVSPDYVIILDADEFLYCKDRCELEKELSQIPDDSYGHIPMKSYVCPTTAPTSVNPLQYMTQRLKEEIYQQYKIVIKVSSIFSLLSISQGNHDIYSPLNNIELKNVTIGHFPIRSPEQMVTKAVIGHMSYLGLQDRNEKQGYQWHNLFHFITSNDFYSWKVASSISKNYMTKHDYDNNIDTVEDPIPVLFEKCIYASKKNYLSTIALSWQNQLLKTEESSLTALVKEHQQAKMSQYNQINNQDPTTVKENGSFDPLWHLKNLFCDISPFKYIIEKYSPKDVIDFGCGVGAYLLIAKELGAQTVLGVDDFSPNYSLLNRDEFLQKDLSTPINLNRKFDLVVCLEVIEHISADCEDTLLDSIASHAKDLILFSGGEPDQPGLGHINTNPLSHWLKKWAARGWFPVLVDSLGYRGLATFSWMKRNPVLLKKSPHGEENCIRKLTEISNTSWKWWGQLASIVSYPFREIPPQGFGIRLDTKDNAGFYHYHLGYFLRNNGNIERAIDALLTAIELDPSLPGPHVQLSHIYNQRGNTEQALQKINDAIAIKGDDPNFYNLLGNLLKNSGDIEGAKKALEKAIELDPSLPEPYVQLSHIYNQRGEMEKALQKINDAIVIKGDDPNFYNLLGNLLKNSGDIEGAKKALEKAIELDPSLPEPYVQLSHIYNQRGEMEKALQKINDAIVIKNDAPVFYHHLGNLLKRRGDLEGAKKALEKAIELDPSIPEPYVQLSHIYSQRGEMEKALQKINDAIVIKNDAPVFYHHLGNLLKRRGDLEGAKKAQEKAIKLDPSIPGPHVQLSHIYNQRGNTEQALQKINDAIAIKGDDPNFYNLLGNLLKNSGDLEGAKKAQEKAIKLDPSISGPHVQLSHIFNQLGNTKLAIQKIKDAIEIQDDIPAFHHHLSNLLRNVGDLEGARIAQEKALLCQHDRPA